MDKKRIAFVGVLITALLGIVIVFSPAKSVLKRIKKSHHAGILSESLQQTRHGLKQKILKYKTSRSPDKEEWNKEDQEQREMLPLYKVIMAPPTNELTKFNTPPPPSNFSTWHSSHGDNTSSKYSLATVITPQNIGNLDVAWTYETNSVAANIQATPIYTGDLVIFPNTLNQIVALAPSTGKIVWTFTPNIRGVARRGLVFWPGDDHTKPRVYFTAQGRLFALDAMTGRPVKAFRGGSLAVGYTVRAAPVVSGNTLLVASFKSALHAFDVHTGRYLWTTDLVLQETKNENIIGPNGRPPIFQGANPWGGFSVDDTRRLAFLSTSNPTPVGIGITRHGPNKNSSSIVAINIDTGKQVWAFQEITHDLWDLDIGAAPVLATITRNGQKIDVVATVTKAGNTLILDRLTGRPVFDYRKKRAPVSQIRGEQTHPYQPDLILPEPFARQEFLITDVTNIGKENEKYVLDQIKNATYGFFEPHVPDRQTVFYGLHGGAMQMGPALDRASGILYIASSHEPSMFTVTDISTRQPPHAKQTLVRNSSFENHCTSCHGNGSEGRSAPALAQISSRFDAASVKRIIKQGYQSMPPLPDISEEDINNIISYLFTQKRDLKVEKGDTSHTKPPSYIRTQYRKLRDHEGFPGSRPPWGTLNALDLNTGHTIWSVPLGRYDKLIKRGIPITGTVNFGGPMVTASGLVFVSGTKDRLIRAFDIVTGEQLWEHLLPFIGSASPMTYIHEGRQYVIIPATGGGTLALYDPKVQTGSSFIAFSLKD